jgi:hypothetical protein
MIMPRNSCFGVGHEPFATNKELQTSNRKHAGRPYGPISFFNPTRAGFTYSPTSTSASVPKESAAVRSSRVSPDAQSQAEDEIESKSRADDVRRVGNVEFDWRSRDNRKGMCQPRKSYLDPHRVFLDAEALSCNNVPFESSG